VQTFCTVSRRPARPLALPTRRPTGTTAGAPCRTAPTPTSWRETTISNTST